MIKNIAMSVEKIKSASKSPVIQKSTNGQNFPRATSSRNQFKNLKKICEGIDILSKKSLFSNRVQEEFLDSQAYLQLLNEKLNKKDPTLEKTNPKQFETKTHEIKLLTFLLADLIKELDSKKDALEIVRNFKNDFANELENHIEGFILKDKLDMTYNFQHNQNQLDFLPKLKKSKSANVLAKSVEKLKQNKKMNKNQVAFEEPFKSEDIAEKWINKRRSTVKVKKVSKVKPEFEDKLNNDQSIETDKYNHFERKTSIKQPRSSSAKQGSITARYLISPNFSQNEQIRTSNLRVDKINYNQKIDNENLIQLKDYAKIKKSNKKHSEVEIENLAKNKIKPEVDQLFINEEESANSNLSDSIIEEAKDELRLRTMKGKFGGYKENDDFDYKVVIPDFQPVKVSFKVGINEKFGMLKKDLIVQKDRIYKNFKLHEIEWHFKNRSLCGVRLILRNQSTGFLLGGQFHGVVGELVDICTFEPTERIIKIEFAYDLTSIKFIEIITSFSRRFSIGVRRSEAVGLGLNFVNRYYPQEIMLCKFFCQFNKSTGKVDYIRFLFIRTVLY